MIYLNGAWTHTWQGLDSQYNTEGCKTILQAFQSKLGKDNCLFSKGAELYYDKDFEKTKYSTLEDYKSKLDLVDVVVLCLGELPSTEKPGDIHSLNLDAEQRALAQLAYAKNKKVIIVLCEGRPRIIHDIVEGAAAIIQAYLPGDYGADALVDLMFGNANFSGRLPYTYPKYDGVIEFYDHPYSVDRAKSGNFDAYSPEYDFGFGLSYSKISYGEIIMDKNTMNQNESVSLSVKIKNESNIAVKEVVQLYLSDLYASMVPTGKSLKKFQKVEIPANGEIELHFSLAKEDLMFVNKNGDFVAEEGDFKITIGNKTASFKLVN
jgi:beta-glucosidase